MKTKLKNEEKIAIEIKLHWITLIIPFFISIILFVSGIVIGSYGLILSLATLLYFAFVIIERNHNLWIVTNFRVIDEKGVLTNNSKESPLDKINNVTYHQSLWGKILGFGNVQIQTAAEVGATTYSMLEKPKKLKDTITEMQEAYKQFQINKQATLLADAIISSQNNLSVSIYEELEKLYALKEKGILTEEEYNIQKAKILKS